MFIVSYLIRIGSSALNDPCAKIFTIEQCCGLLQCPILRLNDEEIAEDELEEEPAAVEDLVRTLGVRRAFHINESSHT